MLTDTEDSGIPSELKNKLSTFDSSLTGIEKCLQPLLDVPEHELKEKMNALDKAKLELAGAYTINSLFWMYLNVCGINPKEHAVKQELDRMKSYMNRVREIQDKANAPKLDKGAAKRFMKSALWQAAKTKTDTPAVSDGVTESTPSTSTDGNTDRKRPAADTPHSSHIKKKKKKDKHKHK